MKEFPVKRTLTLLANFCRQIQQGNNEGKKQPQPHYLGLIKRLKTWTVRSGHQQNISKLPMQDFIHIREPGIGDEVVNKVSGVEDDKLPRQLDISVVV